MFIDLREVVNWGDLGLPGQSRWHSPAIPLADDTRTGGPIIAKAEAIWRQFARYRPRRPRSIGRHRSHGFAGVPAELPAKNPSADARDTRRPGFPSDREIDSAGAWRFQYSCRAQTRSPVSVRRLLSRRLAKSAADPSRRRVPDKQHWLTETDRQRRCDRHPARAG